jgi:hypothetical protein
MNFRDLVYDVASVIEKCEYMYLIDPRLAQHYINIQDWHEWWDAAVNADMEDAWHA